MPTALEIVQQASLFANKDATFFKDSLFEWVNKLEKLYTNLVMLQREGAAEDKRHAEARDKLNSRLLEIQKDCPHIMRRSGVSYDEPTCLICGHE